MLAVMARSVARLDVMDVQQQAFSNPALFVVVGSLSALHSPHASTVLFDVEG